MTLRRFAASGTRPQNTTILLALLLLGTPLLSLSPAQGAARALSPAQGAARAQAPAQPAAHNGSMTLVYQTPSVGASGDFTMRLRVERPPAPSDPEVAITVYPTVATRSEFALTLADRIERDPLLPVQTFPLSSLSPDAAGEIPIVLRFADRLSLGRTEGVFPLRVDLRERAAPPSRSGTEPASRSGTEPASRSGTAPGRLLQRFVTHVVYVPVQPTGAKLGAALVLPVHAPPGLPADGTRQRQDLDHLAAVTSGLDALRSVPVALAPTPETLSTLASDTDGKAVAVLRALQQRAAAMTVLAGTYVPTDLPALLAAKLDVDALTQVTRGIGAAADALRTRPDARTWWGPGPLDESSLALLERQGIGRVVVGEADLTPVTSQKLTLTQPFMLSAGAREVPAVAADAGLAAYFDSRTPPVLGANHLLADLAVIYLDRPGDDGRGVVAMAPPAWRVDRQFLETVAAGWNQNPMVEPMSLDTLFAAMAVPKDDGDGPPVRTSAAPPAAALRQLAPDLHEARRRLDALATVLGPGTADHGILEERLLLAESTALGSNGERQEYVDAVLSGIDDQREDIRMPGGRSITLTARTAEIPVTFQNLTGAPAKVVVKMQSDKLEFPQGNVQTIDLTRRNTTERFSVVSRTSGAFPLRITLESPDGNLVIGQARLTVRSAAASSISLIVSVGAAVFLAVWWGRHALRGRRARRLVPT